MILRMDSRLAFALLFGATQLLGACAKKKAKKSDSVETTADAGSGDQAPPPGEDGGSGDDAPGQTDGGDKSVDDHDDPAPGPKDDGSSSPDPTPYGQVVEPSVASIQTKLLDVYCVKCHQGATPRAGLDLTSLQKHLDGTAAGTYQGRLLVPGHAELSTLALVIDPAVEHSAELPAMPPAPSGIPAVTADQAKAVKDFINGLGGATDISLPGTADASDGTPPPPPTDDGGAGEGSGTADVGTADVGTVDVGTTDVGTGDSGDTGGSDRGDSLDPGAF